MARSTPRKSRASRPPQSGLIPGPGRALAIAAHPDDIEFYMAGTLLLLRQLGWEIHYLTLASGSCGSLSYPPAKIRRIRARESRQAAAILGAVPHPSLVDDLEIFYDARTLRRLAAIVREVNPSLVFTHSPQDYMEDHMTTCRLAVTAVFARGMPNFRTTPARPPCVGDATIYHAMPHGLCDGLRRRIIPGAFVDTTSVHDTKRRALAAHDSQKAWLDASQGMDSYLKTMDALSRAVGVLSRRFTHAEGWRRHSHLGFGETDTDPLRAILGNHYQVNAAYERSLKKGM